MNKIITDPKILAGKPVIKGTRISVELILKLLGEGKDIDYILEQYPQLKRSDIFSAIEYARGIVANEDVVDLRISFA